MGSNLVQMPAERVSKTTQAPRPVDPNVQRRLDEELLRNYHVDDDVDDCEPYPTRLIVGLNTKIVALPHNWFELRCLLTEAEFRLGTTVLREIFARPQKDENGIPTIRNFCLREHSPKRSIKTCYADATVIAFTIMPTILRYRSTTTTSLGCSYG